MFGFNLSKLKIFFQQPPCEAEPFFWQKKKLTEMNKLEWEMLCDGCGKCCLYKTDRKDGKKTLFTKVACRMLDLETCRCRLYEHRQKAVNDCLKITLKDLKKEPRWLPKTCAYYLLYQGEDLKDWHYLISGDKNTVHTAKMSVRGRAISENDTTQSLMEHIVDWDDV